MDLRSSFVAATQDLKLFKYLFEVIQCFYLVEGKYDSFATKGKLK